MWPLREPPTDEELEVAGILCNLEELILKDEFRRSNLSLVAGMSSWGTKKPRTLRHKPPGPPSTLPSPPSVPPPPPPTADEGGGDGCGGPRSSSPVTPLSFPGNRGDNDDAGPSALATLGQSRHIVENDFGSSAALPSLPGNRPDHNDSLATSGHGRHIVVDDVGPSELATSRQETHTVDGDTGPSAPPFSVPRNRSENNDAGPRGAAPLPRGKQFKNPKRRRKEVRKKKGGKQFFLLEKAAAALAHAHHISLDLELRLRQPSPPAPVHHPTLASVRPPGETAAALRWGCELQLRKQSADRKEVSRLARKRRMEIQREKKMQKKAKGSD
ncbi:hypothetical protein BHE74_00032419 [Ensete ventricosum]|nr:hypothetical protein BHE74_00032419 [Ensete ventricosum]